MQRHDFLADRLEALHHARDLGPAFRNGLADFLDLRSAGLNFAFEARDFRLARFDIRDDLRARIAALLNGFVMAGDLGALLRLPGFGLGKAVAAVAKRPAERFHVLARRVDVELLVVGQFLKFGGARGRLIEAVMRGLKLLAKRRVLGLDLAHVFLELADFAHARKQAARLVRSARHHALRLHDVALERNEFCPESIALESNRRVNFAGHERRSEEMPDRGFEA